MIEYQPITYKCSNLHHKTRLTCKYILLLKWSSFVNIVDFIDFVEVVVVAVGPEPHGEEGNGAGCNIWLQWKWEGNRLNKRRVDHRLQHVKTLASWQTLTVTITETSLKLFIHVMSIRDLRFKSNVFFKAFEGRLRNWNCIFLLWFGSLFVSMLFFTK